MPLIKFERQTQAILENYVYLMVDPRSATIFYVGKAAKNDRPFNHLNASTEEGKKAEVIKEIRAEGLQPEVHILRHGLPTAKMAEEVEAAVIDAIGLENLTNLCRGKRIEQGRATAAELNHRYGSQPVVESSLKDRLMKIWINQTYSPTMNAQQLYDTTRQFWYKVGKQVRTPNGHGTLPYPTVLALVDNVVVMAYRVEAWLPAGATMSTRVWQGSEAGERWEFVGNALPNHRLVGKRLVGNNGKRIRGNGQGYGYIN
jgi:hypothetical protein